MAGLGRFIVGILFALVSVAINAWAGTLIFKWVLTPAYGIVVPSFGQLFLFFMLWSAINVRFGKHEDEMTWEQGVEYSIISNLVTLIMIGIAWFVSLLVL